MVVTKLKTSKESLVLVLWLMGRSTKSRVEFFVHRNKLNEYFIKENLKFDNETALPTNLRTIYEATHIEYIFSAIQAVETLTGVLHTAYRLTFEKEKKLEKIVRLILNPDKGQRKKRRNFQKILSAEEIEYDTLCDIMALPRLDSFSESYRVALQKIFEPTFLVSRKLIQYSQLYNEMFRVIRNIFAHNYRFLFFDKIKTKVTPQTEQSIVSFLNHEDLDKGFNILLDPFQRAACFHLVLQLARLERWILTNIRNCVLNNLNPILPEYPLYIEEEDSLEEYKRIRLAQGYVIDEVSNRMEVEGNLSKQRRLHWDFLGYFKSTIYPDLKFITPDGQELRVHFDEL